MSQYIEPESHDVCDTDGLDSKKKAQLYCIRSGYVLRQIAGEYAIVPIGEENLINNAIMTPNDSAAFLWNAFQQPRTIEEVVALGMQEYEVTQEQLRKDVEHFVEESFYLKILAEVV